MFKKDIETQTRHLEQSQKIAETISFISQRRFYNQDKVRFGFLRLADAGDKC